MGGLLKDDRCFVRSIAVDSCRAWNPLKLEAFALLKGLQVVYNISKHSEINLDSRFLRRC